MKPALTARRGGPLAMLAVLLAAWIAGRAILWESPFSLPMPAADIFLAEGSVAPASPPSAVEAAIGQTLGAQNSAEGLGAIQSAAVFGRRANTSTFDTLRPLAEQRPTGSPIPPIYAAGHSFLMAAAFKVEWNGPRADGSALAAAPAQTLASQAAPPFASTPVTAAQDTDRWSLDAFAFYRAGSGSTSISQGRVPVYGASQVALNLQYRFNPASSHDPRAYVRAYRAFVPDAENEVATGVSARPYGPVPLRVAAELRVTNNTFGTQVRPAAYVVTELPAQRLPFDLRMEAYGGAGYVGGDADTPFVDGQAAITREVVSFDGPSFGDNARDRRVRLSVGGGAWGGAQKDASRLDVGPSVRLDLTIGDVPARLSVDWRERVAGDAAPESGVAATLSTRF